MTQTLAGRLHAPRLWSHYYDDNNGCSLRFTNAPRRAFDPSSPISFSAYRIFQFQNDGPRTGQVLDWYGVVWTGVY